MGGRSSKAGVSYDVVEQVDRGGALPTASGNGSGSGSVSPSGSPSDSPDRPAGNGHSPTPSLHFSSLSAELPTPALFPPAAAAASSSSSPPSSPSSRRSGPLLVGSAGSAEGPPAAVILASTHSFPSLRDWGNPPIPVSGHLSSPSVQRESVPEIPVNPSPSSLLPPTQQASPWAPVQQGPPPPLPSGWAFDIDSASGFPYFYNSALRLSQWEDPRGRGWGLPDAGTSSSNQPYGLENPGVAPWEGGSAQGNPLDWSLPPGWSRVEDPTSGRQLYVNYDAQLLLETDPRILIATSASHLRPARGVPVAYPPPWVDVPVGTEQQPPLPVPEPPCPSSDTNWVPSPPPPAPGRQPSLWWKLGGQAAAAGKSSQSARGTRTSFLLLHNAHLPNKENDFVETEPRKVEKGKKKDRLWSGGRGERGSTSSSDDDEQDRNGTQESVALAGMGIAAEGLAETLDNTGDLDGGSGEEGGSTHGSNSGEENDTTPEALLAVSGMEAILAYGGAGPRDLPGGGPGGGTSGGCAGAGVRCAPTVRSGKSQKPQISRCTRHASEAKFKTSRRGHVSCELQGIAPTVLAMVDSLYLFLFAVLCIMSLPTLWTLSLLFTNSISQISCLRKSRIWNACGLFSHNARQYCFRRLLSIPDSKSSLSWLSRWLASLCFKLQAGYYRQLCNHEHPKLKALTVQDGAAPLHSRLPRRDREVTIVTQASVDRLPAIKAMASSWGGPLCVAVYVRSRLELEEVYPQLCVLHAQIEEMGVCKLHLCVFMEESFDEILAPSNGLYPVNAMRNLALQMATTELVFLLDADFIPSPRLHDSLTDDEDLYRRLLRDAKDMKKMFVVAAFEGAEGPSFSQVEDLVSRIPRSFEDLRKTWYSGLGQGFHCGHFPRGHQPTDYEYFFRESTSEPYAIPYREFYEPYVICARSSIPLFDERFTGYGLNKISHAYHCASLGMKFCVLRRHFVWAVPHPRSESWSQTYGFNRDPLQVLRVHGLYYRFKRDLAQSKSTSCVGLGSILKATWTATFHDLLHAPSVMHQRLRAKQPS